MSDLIKILPDHVANQIAAGEVVQRPASMVKELMENAVDAGAGVISVVVRDGGKSLVQVIDDGIGMSAADAVLAFARHATSKIRKSKDLFALNTFGFRGEALASIASVAEVELRTRRGEEEVGTLVTIAGGTEEDAKTECTSCPKGTSITVRNLFFNTPARRKFLKTDTTETKQILAEFQRVALCNPDKAFTLVADDKTLLSLAPGSLHQRIVGLVGKRIGNQLLDVEVDTPIVKIGGYIGLPGTAKKGTGEQFFFVNGRYFRSTYLQKAVVNGYNKLLPFGYTPSYFIYIEVDPARIDVNIHPQKTEIKFEDEQAMWQIISSAVARSLGKHNVVPMLDFDNKATGLEIPVYNPGALDEKKRGAQLQPKLPGMSAGTSTSTSMGRGGYNPFKSYNYDREEWNTPGGGMGETRERGGGDMIDPEQVPFTEMIPPGLVEGDEKQDGANSGGFSIAAAGEGFYSELPSAGMELPGLELESVAGAMVGEVKSLVMGDGKYVATVTADGLVVIDRGRAMYRITYEELLAKMVKAMEDGETVGGGGEGQRQLFPEKIELAPADHFLLMEHADELMAMGFDLRDMGGATVVVYGLPVEMSDRMTPQEAVEDLLEQIRQEGGALRDNHRERLAALMARSCTRYTAGGGGSSSGRGNSGGKRLTQLEADTLVKRLFACEEPNYTPDGKPVMTILQVVEIEKRLKKKNTN